MRLIAPLLILPFALTACMPEAPSPAPDSTAIEDACGAAALQDLVGQSAEKLAVMRFANTVRIIRPGMAVTMDYRAERLNIEIDATEKISRITCG